MSPNQFADMGIWDHGTAEAEANEHAIRQAAEEHAVQEVARANDAHALWAATEAAAFAAAGQPGVHLMPVGAPAEPEGPEISDTQQDVDIMGDLPEPPPAAPLHLGPGQHMHGAMAADLAQAGAAGLVGMSQHAGGAPESALDAALQASHAAAMSGAASVQQLLGQSADLQVTWLITYITCAWLITH